MILIYALYTLVYKVHISWLSVDHQSLLQHWWSTKKFWPIPNTSLLSLLRFLRDSCNSIDLLISDNSNKNDLEMF